MLEELKQWAHESIIDEILIFALIIAIIESIAQNVLKTSKTGTIKFIVGLFIYLLIGYLLHFVYENYELSKINLIWSCLSIILGIVMGYYLYDEDVNHKTILSLGLAISAIVVSNS